MKKVHISLPMPNDDPETVARWLHSQIGEMLQRIEWIGQLTEESAKLGVFDKPVWTRDQRRLAKKLRSFYAHDLQRIDRNGTAHFFNKGKKKGAKKSRGTLHQISEDWGNMYALIHETLVTYFDVTLICQTCGIISYGTNLPDCGHCTAPPKTDKVPLMIEPKGATLDIKNISGRADTIDEFAKGRMKGILADGAWEIMMETGLLPTDITHAVMGDDVIPEEQKPRILREAWPV